MEYRSRSNLTDALAALRSYTRGRREIVAVYLFGSQASGEADELSDIDVALLLRDGLPDPAHLELRLAVEVSSMLGSDDVDVVVLNDAPLEAQFEIVSTGRLIHSNDEPARTDYEVLMMSKYWDFKKYLDEYDFYVLKRIREQMSDAERRVYQAARDTIRKLHKKA
jgi:predicted nucleotidyltransferase